MIVSSGCSDSCFVSASAWRVMSSGGAMGVDICFSFCVWTMVPSHFASILFIFV